MKENPFFIYYPYLLKTLQILKDRRQKHTARFHTIRGNFYKTLWTETAHQIGAEIHDIGYGFYKIQAGDRATYVYNSMVMLDNHLTLKIAGNKPLVSSLLSGSEHQYPIARFVEYDLTTLKKAYSFLEDIKKPGVVKPADSGSAGQGITTGIDSWKRFKKASFHASIFAQKLLLEEQIEGDSFRILYLNGQYLDAVRRNPPQVLGDGKRSIEALIEDENMKRVNDRKFRSLHPLTIDLDSKFFLRSQGYGVHDVLPENRRIAVKRVVNQNSCYENESVKSIVHPSIIEMGARMTGLFHVQLAGVDLITPDITKPLAETRGIMGELNTTPGLHHHYLISNESEITPVARHILELLLNSP